jgi:hypothetical protein
MMRVLLAFVLGVALLCGPTLAPGPQKAIAAPDDPKGDMVKVKSVDPKTNTLIVTTPEGKTVKFTIDDKVKIVGPLEGVSEDRLKDDRIVAGSEITLFYAADKKTLTKIKLGFRKKDK